MRCGGVALMCMLMQAVATLWDCGLGSPASQPPVSCLAATLLVISMSLHEGRRRRRDGAAAPAVLPLERGGAGQQGCNTAVGRDIVSGICLRIFVNTYIPLNVFWTLGPSNAPS